MFHKPMAKSRAASLACNHDRLDLRLLTLMYQRDEADQRIIGFGDPDEIRPHSGDVIVKLQSRILSPDGWIIVDVPVTLSHLGPQSPAAIQI
jgi:hypothetical protein